MKAIIIFAMLAVSMTAIAQKESFDLATYTPPKAWKKQSDKNGVQYTKEDAAKGTYCIISLLKAVQATDNPKENFDLAWGSIVKEMVTATAAPEMQEAVTENGWEMQSGYAPFEHEGNKGIVMLVTASGGGKMMNLVVLTNTDAYQQHITAFVESISLKKAEQSTAGNTNENTSITGIWKKNSSVHETLGDPVSHNNAGYTSDQYTFNNDGTYSFFSKTFRYSFDKLLLVKESGTYKISGNSLTLNPQKSIIEAWSKKDGTDKWGKLLTTQNRTLEKGNYKFTKHYFSGIDQWNLVFQSGAATKRDGPFSTNTTFSNAWYYAPISPNNPVIELPGKQTASQETKTQPAQAVANNGYKFTTTNFDDGWTSVVQEDWIQVTKGAIVVLIHYPNKQADQYNSDLMASVKNAWNVLVAPKYSSVSNLEFKPISSWQSIEFAEADAVEKSTGKQVHVVLFQKQGASDRYLEFITPDKGSYEQEFGAYHQASYGWEKVEAMGNYNKFAVAASDLTGNWTNSFTGMIQYVNAQTGLDAGMNTHSSVVNYQIGAGGNYKWEITVASGYVGNIKFQGAKSSGKLSMVNNWQIKFSDIEGRPRTYDVWFSCIKGARILWIDGEAFGKKD